MNDVLIRILPYAVPPVLGAIIGYVTNHVAIRMLFRPLTEKRIFGIRVPFTPGIIPGQRYQLSASIAKMVSTRLLTADAVEAKLAEPSFVEHLTESVSRLTTDILDGTAEGVRDGQRELPGAADLVTVLIEGFVSSAAFRDAARGIVNATIDGVLDLSLAHVTPGDEALDRFIDTAVDGFVAGRAGAALRASVVRWVSARIADDAPLHEVVGPEALERIGDLLPRSYDPILESILTFLRQPETRRDLAIHGRVLLKQILNKLNLFQRFLVSATQYDRSLNENMPAIVKDLIDSLEQAGRSADTRSRVVAVFRSRLSEWGETGIGTLSESLGVDLADLAGRMVSAGLDLVTREGFRANLKSAVGGYLRRRAADSIEGLLSDLVGIRRDAVTVRAVEAIDAWMQEPGVSHRIAGTVSRFIADSFGGPARGPLRNLIVLTDGQKLQIDRALAAGLKKQLVVRVPELVEGLDVYGMVVQKIDALDVESVEQLLLMVIAKHLKWINMFGALLGALIGAAQVVVSQIT